MGLFDNTQYHKEIGAIALSGLRQNLKTAIICGKFQDPPKNISSGETGLVKRNFVTKFIDAVIAFKYVISEHPDNILMYNIENYGNVFLILATILFRKLFCGSKHKTKILIKADSDGSFIEMQNKLYLLMYKILIMIYSKITSGIIVETTCGINKIEDFVNKQCRLIYLPNGYSSDIFGFSDSVTRKQIITCIANITPSKNVEAVIRVFYKLSKEFTEAKLKIAGNIEDLSYFDRVKRLISDLNLQDKTEIVKLNASELADLLGHSILSISTSIRESFGISRMESLGSGTPVVTYDAGCGADFRKFGAIVVPLGDEERLYVEAFKLMSDHLYWHKKSEESRKLAVSWDYVVEKLIHLFDSTDVRRD